MRPVQNPRVLISVIIPAFNEEAYLGGTLSSVNRSISLLTDVSAEIIVVDNASEDSTANVARESGATVITETQHNVAKVRNSGARHANGDVFVFVDADTIVPETLLGRIADTMTDTFCVAGAVDTDYQARKFTVRLYLQCWRVIGRLFGMAQGATQFCRRDIFLGLNGYDETLFMGEDVDFYWRLRRSAKKQKRRVALIEDLRVVPSSRRFDQWNFWRTLVWTNPLFILLFRRKKAYWGGWYKTAPR